MLGESLGGRFRSRPPLGRQASARAYSFSLAQPERGTFRVASKQARSLISWGGAWACTLLAKPRKNMHSQSSLAKHLNIPLLRHDKLCSRRLLR